MKKPSKVLWFGFIAVLFGACISPITPGNTSNKESSTGSIVVSIQSGGKAIVPDWASVATSYHVTLTSHDGYASQVETITSGNTTTFGSVQVGTWDVGVTALNGTAVVGMGSQTNLAVAAGVTLSKNVTVSGTQNGTGGFSFTFTFPSQATIDYVSGQLYTNAGDPLGSPIVASLTSAGGNTQGILSQAGIASGSYRLQLTFKRGGASGTIAGIYGEAVNIWDNVTSNQWLDSSGNLNSQRTFALTDFNSTNTSLSNVVFSYGGTALTLTPGFSSNITTYTVCIGSGNFIITPTQSIAGQRIQYQVAGGSWTDIASNTASPNLSVNAGVVISVKVTATDQVSSSIYTITAIASPTVTSFNFTAPAATGIISSSTHTIVLSVAYGTNMTALVPTITITGASVSPASGTAQNFTSPVTYTVTAADSTTQAYTVTVTVALNPAKAITAFNFTTPAVTGTITEASHAIALTVPYGTSVTALVPTIIITGASVSPASGTAQNFTSPVTYTVTAADSTTQAYMVTVTVALNPAKAITAFNFTTPAVTGTITEASHTIALTVPYGTSVTALVPTITITGGSVSPASGTPQNFTNPVTYTVTAADSTTQAYTVTVTIAAAAVIAYRVTAAAYNGQIWSTTNLGSIWAWIASGPIEKWGQLTGNVDGSILVASYYEWAQPYPHLYHSTDSGATWTQLTGASPNAFYNIASSDNGTILGIPIYNGAETFYYSTNSGTTWSLATISGGSNAYYWSNAGLFFGRDTG